MARPKKAENEKVIRLSVSIKSTTMKALDKFVEDNCIVKSKLIDKIIREYLDGMDKRKS